MELDKTILDLLRKNADSGESVASLVKMIQERIGLENCSSFLILNYFMNAFNLSFSQVKEMPGAECLGGRAYSDDEIDKIVKPFITN